MKTLISNRNLWISGLKIVFVVMLFLTFSASVAQAGATLPQLSTEVQMTAIPAFDGNFKYGEWLPVFIELANEGSDVQVSIRIPVLSASGTINYESPVELPSGAHKRVTLYVLPNNYTRQLNVELAEGEILLASHRIDVRPNPNVNFLIGLIAQERGALSLINTVEIPGIKRTKVLVDIPVSEIPDKFEGLRSFDLIVLNRIDTGKLSIEQSNALETWVSQGGQLVIGGGAEAQITTSGLPPTIFPAQITETLVQNDLPVLEDFVGSDLPIRIPGPFVVSKFETKSGRSIAGQTNQSFIHEWDVGKGSVTFVSIDLSAPPFDAWNGTTSFWQKLISRASIYPDWLPTDISARQQFASNMPYSLTNLPVLDLPSAKSLALMLALYIVVVGPLNYYFLQRSKKLQLAWITIPAITLFFSVASFGLGFALHGTDIFINKIAVIQTEASGNAHYDGFVGIFSPAQTSYQVEVNGSNLISPLGPNYDPWSSVSPPAGTGLGRTMTLVQSTPAYVKGFSIDQWSMQSFMSEGSIENFGVISAELHLENDQLTGHLYNTTPSTFLDSFVILGSRFVRPGLLAPGDSVEIKLDLSNLGAPNTGASLSYSLFEKELNSATETTQKRLIESKRSIVENLFERVPPYSSFSANKTQSAMTAQSPTFIGWIETAPPEVRIPGSEASVQSNAVVLTPLTYELTNSSLISVPVGLIPGRLVENPRDGGSCGMPGTTAVYISRGQAIFEFTLPPLWTDLAPQNIKLGIWSDSGIFSPPDFAIYHWDEGSWISLSGLNQGINLIPNGWNFIDSDGLVRIRLSTETGQNCYYVALGLDGKHD